MKKKMGKYVWRFLNGPSNSIFSFFLAPLIYDFDLNYFAWLYQRLDKVNGFVSYRPLTIRKFAVSSAEKLFKTVKFNKITITFYKIFSLCAGNN